MKFRNFSWSFLVKITFVLCFVFICLLFGARVLIKGSKEINYLENRGAYQVPKISLKSFLNGSYQNDLEKAVNDQLWGSELLKKTTLQYNNFISEKLIIPFRSNSYYIVAGYYAFGNADYLLYKPYTDEFLSKYTDLSKKIAEQFAKVELENKYIYYINNDRSIDFENINNEMFEDMTSLFPDYEKAYLEVDSYEDYKNYFYKTDHHWNHRGAYQGYKDIIKLLLGEDENVLQPLEEVEFKYITYGSKARNAQYFDFKENFMAYKFDMPKFDTYVDGVKMTYGNKEEHFANPNKMADDYNMTYAAFYGGDKAEVIFDYKQEEKENLLIIGFSDTNAVDELIASHFNKTHVIDLRKYKDFEINEYIKENNIDKFIFIANPGCFIIEDSLLWD